MTNRTSGPCKIFQHLLFSNNFVRNQLLTLRCSAAAAAITKMSGSRLSTSTICQAQKKVEVLGVQINYDKVGSGVHPVICLPGALGTIDSDFGPILKKFSTSDKFTVVAWDPPGYGKSRPPNRDFSGGAQFFHTDANYANELMKKLGYGKYTILGWSDGGITGLIQAAHFPSQVQALVVWGANAYITQEDKKLYESVRDIDKWSERMRTPMINMYGEEYFRKYWTQWVDTFEDIFNKGGDLCRDDLKNIKCPTLIIHGMKDAMVPTFHAEYLHKNIQGSELITLPDGKHNLHLRYADDFVGMVEKFLSQKV